MKKIKKQMMDGNNGERKYMCDDLFKIEIFKFKIIYNHIKIIVITTSYIL